MITSSERRGGVRSDGAHEDAERATLRRDAEIDQHVAFVRKICQDHRVDPERNRTIFETLHQIREHEAEPRLFMGIVGEFSSGKSTLINALLRDDLLRTNVLQGTTTAATLLMFGPCLAVRIRPLPSNAAVSVFRAIRNAVLFLVRLFKPLPNGREALRDRIHQASADEAISRNVLQVEVQHPADSLRRGMVIVDLPGTNAENPRHGQVTAAALQDLCDAAIIVIPADAPGAESLWNFLQKHIERDVLRRCAFVLNKIDCIRRTRDRELLIDNVRKRLTNDLGISKPRVLAAAPGRLMESLPGAKFEEGEDRPTPAEIEKWTREFAHAENQLWKILHESKVLLQVERLVPPPSTRASQNSLNPQTSASTALATKLRRISPRKSPATNRNTRNWFATCWRGTRIEPSNSTNFVGESIATAKRSRNAKNGWPRFAIA